MFIVFIIAALAFQAQGQIAAKKPGVDNKLLFGPDQFNQFGATWQNGLNQLGNSVQGLFGMQRRQTIIPIPVPIQTRPGTQPPTYYEPVWEYYYLQNMQQFMQVYPWYNNGPFPNQEYIIIQNQGQIPQWPAQQFPAFGVQNINGVNVVFALTGEMTQELMNRNQFIRQRNGGVVRSGDKK